MRARTSSQTTVSDRYKQNHSLIFITAQNTHDETLPSLKTQYDRMLMNDSWRNAGL